MLTATDALHLLLAQGSLSPAELIRLVEKIQARSTNPSSTSFMCNKSCINIHLPKCCLLLFVTVLTAE